jgi:methyl-accepting chemotaxis protein
MSDYLILAAILAMGGVCTLLPTYLIFGRGLALRLLTVTVVICDASSAALYYLGHEGWDPVRTVIVLCGVLPVIVALFLYELRKIIFPIAALSRATKRLSEEDLTRLEIAIGAMSKGDLTVTAGITAEPVSVSGWGEIGELASTLNRMVASLQSTGRDFDAMAGTLSETIRQTRHSSDTVARTSADVNAAATETSHASRLVAQTISQVAVGAGDQAHAASQSNLAVQDLMALIKQVQGGAIETTRGLMSTTDSLRSMADAVNAAAGAGEEVRAVSAEAASAADRGSRSVAETVAGMRRIQAATNDAATQVMHLGEKGDQIGAIVETIDDIAEQTNLLALNAAIEAARAGEQGKGFAVVADEVRKLAERSSRATKEIAALIAEVQKGTAAAVQAMNAGAGEVNAGVTLADQAGEALTAIAVSVEATQASTAKISGAVDEIRTASETALEASDQISGIAIQTSQAAQRMGNAAKTVAESVEAIAAVSEETSASAQEVSAATQEMSAQSEHVMIAVQSLSEQASHLDALVAGFKVDGAGSAKVRAVPGPKRVERAA